MRNDCHPGKLITHAVVYPHNRHRRCVPHGGEEKPAGTLGLCTVHCVRRPQTAFELLPVTADVPGVYVCARVCACMCTHVHVYVCARTCVCVCTCVCAYICEGEAGSEERDGSWKAAC